ncbi:MAG: M48 family metalloprotease [Burkholderiaceae bacterium]
MIASLRHSLLAALIFSAGWPLPSSAQNPAPGPAPNQSLSAPSDTQAEALLVRRDTALRSGPAASSSELARLPPQTPLTRTSDRLGGWMQVKTPSGSSGWVSVFDVSALFPGVADTSPRAQQSNFAVDALRGVTSLFRGRRQTLIATSTLGIRRLGGEFPFATPNLAAVAQADAQRLSPAQAEQFAAEALLRPAAVPALPGAAVTAPAADLAALLAQAAPLIDEPTEIDIGRQYAAVLLASKPLHPDMALQRYVNQLGRWLSLHSGRPQLPWVFGVLNDEGFNALAAPGGYVFITQGLLASVGSEAELAGLLAQQIAHVSAKHHLKALAQAARADAAARANAAADKPGQRPPDAAPLAALSRQVLLAGLPPADELQADRQSVVLAARAGFDPYGLVAVLLNLRDVAEGDPLFTHTVATHPPAQARLDALDQAMGNRLDGFTGQTPVPIAQRLTQNRPK